MSKYISQRSFLLITLLISLAAHLCAMFVINNWSSYEFALPPNADEFILADLYELPAQQVKSALSTTKTAQAMLPPHDALSFSRTEQKQAEAGKTTVHASAEQITVEDDSVEQSEDVETVTEMSRNRLLPPEISDAKLPKLLPPIRHVGEFIRTTREKLYYRISLFGIPVGSAELEARNDKGELRITSRTRSSSFLALIYPVEIMSETRMFNGRYIMTTLKQREGDLLRDTGFTICLGEKNVFWADRLLSRFTNNPIPNEEVLDIFSAFYSMRNQHLTVGQTIVFHIFDSSSYAPTTVNILRREKIHLHDFSEVETLVVQPKLMTEGFFRRAGEIFIWLTDDEFHVPVRMETEIGLGKVTAELIKAETE